MKSQHPIEGNPANAVLVVVNMQNEFCMPGGVHYDAISPAAMPGIIQATQGLLRGARAAGIPVVHIQSVRDPQAPQFTVFGEQAMLKPESWNSAVIEPLTPAPGEHVVRASYDDPFHKTRLDHLLLGLGPEPTEHQIVVVGGHINGALYYVVDHLYLRGYWTVMPLDAIYGDAVGTEFAHALFGKPSFPNIFFTAADKVAFSPAARPGVRGLVPRL